MIGKWFINTLNNKKCKIAGISGNKIYFDYREYDGAIHSCDREIFKKYFVPE